MSKPKYNGENKLEISLEEIEEAKASIFAVLGTSEFKGDIGKKADEIIDKAIYGWRRAPDLFRTRVKMLLGHNALFIKNKNLSQNFMKEDDEEEEKAKLDEKTIKQRRSMVFSNLGKGFSVKDRRFIRNREREYRRDYEFNSSSDFTLLSEVLVDELLLHKLQNERVINTKATDIESRIAKVQERLSKNMEKLGILRNQRIEQDSNIAGNISEVSVMVEKKLEEIKSLNNLNNRRKKLDSLIYKIVGFDKEEFQLLLKEIELQRKHDMEPPRNVIPEAEAEKIKKELTSAF